MRGKTGKARKNRFYSILLIVVLSFLFAGYGCDDGSDLKTGILEDSALGGVDYTSLTFSGTTNAAGEFKYFSGRTIAFSIGDIALGSAKARQRMTILDLVPGAESVTHPTVSNMARFVQSLDDDGNPENGVIITDAQKSALAGAEIDFTLSPPDFEARVSPILAGLGKTLRSAAEAQEHLRAAILGPFPQSVASGDPRPDSVVLWTRVYDKALPGNDLPVTLKVSADQQMTDTIATRDLTAKADNDNCIKVRIDGLDADTYYFYQFCYQKEGVTYSSPVGRTKTAPEAGADVAVRFAFFSCQDYVGRYYNTYAHLLENYGCGNELDFLVYLGDYIYENEGDPSFQTISEDRDIVFDDRDGAIRRGDADNPFYSAKSLDNYRQLYKTYRGDLMLQKIHEKWPMIAIWDDHEFSDDSWQNTATYFDGLIDETDTQRKQDAERAFFEYMPIAVGTDSQGTLSVDETILYPHTRIYEDFRFGANCHVILSDYRTFRPDHLIPEDAFPGTIVMDQSAAQAMLGPAFDLFAGSLEPYVNIDAEANAMLKAGLNQILTGLYALQNPNLGPQEAAAKAASAATGNISARYINGAFAAAGLAPPIDGATVATLPVGVAYLTMGKTDLYSQFGSRYLVSQDLFHLYANYVDLFVDPSRDDVFGTADEGFSAQESWIRSTLSQSDATWKVFGSSVSFTPMILDLTHPSIAPLLPPGFPDALRARLQMNADQWEGFPVKREAFLNFLSTVPGMVIMSGDIHSSFATDHGDRSGLAGGGGNRVYEFTGAAVSSGTIQDFVGNATQALGLQGVDPLVNLLGTVFQISSIDNPNTAPSRILYDSTADHGYVVLEANAESFCGTFHHVPSTFAQTRYYDNFDELADEFATLKFAIKDDDITPVSE